MLAETIQLEKLRQKIEDVEYEAGSQSDYLDRGKPNSKQAKQAQESIDKLNEQTKALQAELKDLISGLQARQPHAVSWRKTHWQNGKRCAPASRISSASTGIS